MVVNQVMSVRENRGGDVNRNIDAMQLVTEGLQEYSAALGAKWAHYINTRISLMYNGTTGVLRLVKSPFAFFR